MAQEPTPSVVLHDPFSDDMFVADQEPGAQDTGASEESAGSSADAEALSTREVRNSPYELNPDDLYGSFRNLFENDPHFRNVAKSFLGRERQSELQRRVAELEAELSRERYERYQNIVSSIPEDQLEDAIESDASLKEAVDYVQNYDPSDDVGVDLVTMIEDSFDSAEDWLPRERLAQYRASMAPGGCKCNALDYEHGVFDHDPQGKPLSVLRSFNYFKSTLDSEVAFARNAWEQSRAASQGLPATQQQVQAAPHATAPQPAHVSRASVAQSVDMLRNPKLNANPDISSQQVSAEAAQLTKEDIDRMSIEEIIRRWPNDGDFERDVAAGKILIPGISPAQ